MRKPQFSFCYNNFITEIQDEVDSISVFGPLLATPPDTELVEVQVAPKTEWLTLVVNGNDWDTFWESIWELKKNPSEACLTAHGMTFFPFYTKGSYELKTYVSGLLRALTRHRYLRWYQRPVFWLMKKAIMWASQMKVVHPKMKQVSDD